MSSRILWWVGVALLVAILGGLLGWFLFINTQESAVQRIVAGRGFNVGGGGPSGGSTGSTRTNLISFFGSALSGGTTTTDETVPKAPRLWQISPVPATGIASFMVQGSISREILRFVERPTGNVFQVPLTGGNPTRITNTLVPRVYEAVWLNPNALVMRHASDNGVSVRLFLAHIVKATSSAATVASLGGSYLDDGIAAVAAHPSGKEPALLYLLSSDQGAFLIRSQSDGTGPKRVWSSPLSGWRISWLTDDVVLLAQKASEGIQGSAYMLSLKSGITTPLIGNRDGLIVSKHQTQDALLFSTSSHGQTTLFSRVDGVVRKIPLSTFAEKCVWDLATSTIAYCAVPKTMPSVSLPDAWYRGEVTFDDAWFSVNPVSGTTTVLFDPSDAHTSIDVIDPMLDITGTHILFTDGKTETLWSLAL